MTTLSYFASDGNYGTADCVLLATDDWTAEDWRAVHDCSDDERLQVALEVHKKYEAR